MMARMLCLLILTARIYLICAGRLSVESNMPRLRNCSPIQLKDDYYFFESYYKEYDGKNVFVWDKDGFLFPEKIEGQFVMAHRILPDIQLVYFNDFSELKDMFLGSI
jgi:hypothetical protein